MNPLFTSLTHMRFIFDKRMTTYRQNFFDHDLSEYDFIFCYGIEFIMTDLESKCKRELKEGSVVALHGFGFPETTPFLVMDGFEEPYPGEEPIGCFREAV